jgi:hypothetical protein
VYSFLRTRGFPSAIVCTDFCGREKSSDDFGVVFVELKIASNFWPTDNSPFVGFDVGSTGTVSWSVSEGIRGAVVSGCFIDAKGGESRNSVSASTDDTKSVEDG